MHENIIDFKGILFSIDHIFIEMEKCNAGTLDSFINKKKKLQKCMSSRVMQVSNLFKQSSDENKKIESPGIIKRGLIIREEVAAKIIKDICNGIA